MNNICMKNKKEKCYECSGKGKVSNCCLAEIKEDKKNKIKICMHCNNTCTVESCFECNDKK